MAERLSTGLRNGILKSTGESLADILADGIIKIFTGTQPATADAVETAGSTLLVTITLSSGAFTPGSPTNGINLDVAASGAVSKDTGETWSGTAVADGQAGWFRFYDNDAVTGASTTEVRMDGAVSTSGAEINMSNTNIVTSGTVTIDGFVVTLLAS